MDLGKKCRLGDFARIIEKLFSVQEASLRHARSSCFEERGPGTSAGKDQAFRLAEASALRLGRPKTFGWQKLRLGRPKPFGWEG